MGKYKTIAVIYGSDSSEWEISCRSGEYVASCIDGNEYDIYEIFARFGDWSLVAYKKRNAVRVPLPEGSRPQVDKSDFSVTVLGEKVKFDFAYLVQHGAPGENGLMQGYFEMLGVPCSTSSAYVSTVTFDKYSCKSYLEEMQVVKMPAHVFVHKGMDLDAVCAEVNERLKYPVFVKPTQAGSSFGVSKVKDAASLRPAIEFAFSEGDNVLVEQGMKGRELTCAVYTDAEGVKTLPPIQIVTDNDYFDFEAKYKGHSEEICPAPITAGEEAELRSVTTAIYKSFGCRGLVRMDYIWDDAAGLQFLEINTIPGMTSASLVPRMVRTAGMSMTDFLTTVIENS